LIIPNFSHARTALKYGLQSLSIKADDFILLPEYICDVVLHPLVALGVKYRYYSIEDDLTPNWDKLEALVDNNTRAVMMIHYFGQPQDISAFQSFSKKHKLLLIDNNAHGHRGMFNGQLLGTFGDMGISSPRKIINTYSGGVLYIKGKEHTSQPNLLPYPVSISHRIKRNLFTSYPRLKNSIRKKLKNRPKYEDPRAFQEPVLSDYAIDKWSKNIIEHTDWHTLRKIRQESFVKWQTFAINNDLIPVFAKLHPESNPWCYPAYVKSQEEAIEWFDWGWEHNEHIFSWPSLPTEVLENKEKSFDRWKRLVCFRIKANT